VAVSKANSHEQSDDNRRRRSPKDIASRPAGKKAKLANNLPAESADAIQETGGIPRFNLAEQILAEQRKIAAIRRRGPGRKAEAPKQQLKVESITTHTVEPPPILSEQEQIIAEIVARDVQRLCKDNASKLRR
jgi:hypothetical protein